MDANHLVEIRKRLGMKQSEMGAALGIAPRTYQDIETGKADFREVYRMAVELLTLREAVNRGDIDIAEPGARSTAMAYVALFQEGAAAAPFHAARNTMEAHISDQKAETMNKLHGLLKK